MRICDVPGCGGEARPYNVTVRGSSPPPDLTRDFDLCTVHLTTLRVVVNSFARSLAMRGGTPSTAPTR